MRFALVLLATCAVAFPALAQEPGWPYPRLTTAQPTSPPPAIDHAVPPPPPASTPLTFVEGGFRAAELTEAASGQQHWVSVNAGIFQPSTVRAAFKVWPRPQNSVWVEAYAGSALVHVMYGFGVRVQHTACSFRNGDQLMLAPGVGVHILPNWEVYAHTPHYGWGWGYADPYRSNTLYYVVGDVDISWLHDFSSHFGFELGLRLGLAGRVAGDIGKSYPRSLMFGKDVYPIVAVYSGFRF